MSQTLNASKTWYKQTTQKQAGTRTPGVPHLVGGPSVGSGDVVVKYLAHVADKEAYSQRASHWALRQLSYLPHPKAGEENELKSCKPARLDTFTAGIFM